MALLISFLFHSKACMERGEGEQVRKIYLAMRFPKVAGHLENMTVRPCFDMAKKTLSMGPTCGWENTMKPMLNFFQTLLK